MDNCTATNIILIIFTALALIFIIADQRSKKVEQKKPTSIRSLDISNLNHAQVKLVLYEYALDLCEDWGYSLDKGIRRLEYERFEAIGDRKGSIVIRGRFGNPRIDIYTPDKEGFCSYEFDIEKGQLSSSQIFYDKGVEMYPLLLAEIIDRLNKANESQKI